MNEYLVLKYMAKTTVPANRSQLTDLYEVIPSGQQIRLGEDIIIQHKAVTLVRIFLNCFQLVTATSWELQDEFSEEFRVSISCLHPRFLHTGVPQISSN